MHWWRVVLITVYYTSLGALLDPNTDKFHPCNVSVSAKSLSQKTCVLNSLLQCSCEIINLLKTFNVSSFVDAILRKPPGKQSPQLSIYSRYGIFMDLYPPCVLAHQHTCMVMLTEEWSHRGSAYVSSAYRSLVPSLKSDPVWQT